MGGPQPLSGIIDGNPHSRSTGLAQFPAKSPLDCCAVFGAGGGLIAELAELTQALRVGPQHAGAMPGPVAYGPCGTDRRQ